LTLLRSVNQLEIQKKQISQIVDFSKLSHSATSSLCNFGTRNPEKPEISDFVVFRGSTKNHKNRRFFIFRDPEPGTRNPLSQLISLLVFLLLCHSAIQNFKDVGAKHLVPIFKFLSYKDVAAPPLCKANSEPRNSKSYAQLAVTPYPSSAGLLRPRSAHRTASPKWTARAHINQVFRRASQLSTLQTRFANS